MLTFSWNVQTADDDEAQISISDESFLLVRANSLTNAFVRTVQQQHMVRRLAF